MKRGFNLCYNLRKLAQALFKYLKQVAFFLLFSVVVVVVVGSKETMNAT